MPSLSLFLQKAEQRHISQWAACLAVLLFTTRMQYLSINCSQFQLYVGAGIDVCWFCHQPIVCTCIYLCSIAFQIVLGWAGLSGYSSPGNRKQSLVPSRYQWLHKSRLGASDNSVTCPLPHSKCRCEDIDWCQVIVANLIVCVAPNETV